MSIISHAHVLSWTKTFTTIHYFINFTNFRPAELNKKTLNKWLINVPSVVDILTNTYRFHTKQTRLKQSFWDLSFFLLQYLSRTTPLYTAQNIPFLMARLGLNNLPALYYEIFNESYCLRSVDILYAQTLYYLPGHLNAGLPFAPKYDT